VTGRPDDRTTGRPDPRPGTWLRFAVVQAVQLPSVGLLLAAPSPWAWWPAALWGSIVCCAGTDSGWRWRNRMLVAQAAGWLFLALCFGTGR
jgi:hypothetical protein